MSHYRDEKQSYPGYSQQQQGLYGQYGNSQANGQYGHPLPPQETDPPGNLIYPASSVYVPQVRPKKPRPEDMKYKIQYMGMLITVACTAYCGYKLYELVKSLWGIIYRPADLVTSTVFTRILVGFPMLVATTLSLYFLIKAVLFPSYAAGTSRSDKHWTLSSAHTIYGSYVWFSIMKLVYGLVPYIGNRDPRLELFVDYFLSRSYKDILIVIGTHWVCGQYVEVCSLGDKERFSFIKPWIVDETETDKSSRNV